eukprot:3067-Eustigmatos_ZCMA.PRE.1
MGRQGRPMAGLAHVSRHAFSRRRSLLPQHCVRVPRSRESFQSRILPVHRAASLLTAMYALRRFSHGSKSALGED